MGERRYPPSSRRGVLSGGLRAIRVVWISFRPSEPETGVRILHRPPFFCGEWQILMEIRSEMDIRLEALFI